MLLLRINISVTFRRVTFRCSALQRQAWAICCATSVTCTPSSKLGTRISTLGCRSPRSGFLKQEKKQGAHGRTHRIFRSFNLWSTNLHTSITHLQTSWNIYKPWVFESSATLSNMPRRGCCRLPNEEVPGEWARKLALSRPRSFLDQGHQVGFPMAHTGYHDPQ